MDPNAAHVSEIEAILKKYGFDIRFDPNIVGNWWDLQKDLYEIVFRVGRQSYDAGYFSKRHPRSVWPDFPQPYDLTEVDFPQEKDK